VQELERQVTAWSKARQIREYVAAMRAAAEPRPIQPGSPLEAWLDWSSAYADRVDPATQTKTE
jgi:hypothetical protein